ncbi:DUF927 domain-containing protein [Yoonia vestfoldensis]|uniref:RNA helicase n=1 Tax=Yoonia vestfoldensis TaxID=245188 RepID=A0A1Y0EDY3_9RHOB|nr:DUF927 domain-containing protein [Yoonia vestfoldensis]ARU01815.1 RNA helicase [Yoonia vestfoldensis]
MYFDDFELPPLPDEFPVATIHKSQPEDDAGFQRETIGGLPPGYEFVTRYGVINRLVGKKRERLCGPLKCLSHLKNASGTEAALLFAFIDREQNIKKLSVSADELMCRPSEVVAKFANHGLEIFGTAGQFAAFLKAWRPQHGRLMTKNVGWFKSEKQNAFILRSGDVLSPETDENVVIYTGQREALDASTTAGGLENWKKLVAAPAANNPALVFAISAALAAPLLDILNLNGGGFNLHSRTSAGKTTTLFAATSVWGDPASIPQWHGTQTGFEIAALRSNDNLFAIDEFKEGDLRSSTAIIYFILNGSGALRSDQNLSFRQPSKWCNIVLTTSESAFTTHFKNAKKEMPEGLTVRLADINIGKFKHGAFNDIGDFENAGKFSDVLRQNCSLHYGRAGPAFAERLVNLSNAPNCDDVFRKINKLHTRITQYLAESIPPKIELDGPYYRVLDVLACCVVAGLLATRCNILPWDRNEAIRSIIPIAKIWAEERSIAVVDMPTRLIRHLQDYIRKNTTRFADLDAGQSVEIQRQLGWFSDNRLDIKALELRSICGNIIPSETEAIKLLHASGILIPGGEARSLQHRASQKIDERRTRVYRLDLSILFPDENPF